MSQKPKSFLGVFTERGPLTALLVAGGLFFGIIAPASAQFFGFGGPQQPPLAMTAEESPVWTRSYGGDTTDCAALASVEKTLGIKRMVVGHTVQKSGVNALCDGALWRIDVGLAKLYDGPIQVLEVYPSPKVLSGTRL